MKKTKTEITTTLYYFASVGFFIAAIIGFGNDSSSAPAFLCLGAAMLCLGTSYANNTKKKEKQMEQDREERE